MLLFTFRLIILLLEFIKMLFIFPHLQNINMPLRLGVKVYELAIKRRNKRVALHELIIKVGKDMRILLIYDDAKPETEAGNVDCSLFYIHSIDVVGDNFCLQCSIVTFQEIAFFVLCPCIDKYSTTHEFVEQPHRECPRTDGRVAYLHVADI